MMSLAAIQLFKKIAPFLLIAALFGATWAHGYHKADIKRIEQLSAIQAQSDALLDAAIRQNAINEENARQFNQTLEESHAQAINTANSYRDIFVGRLHDSRASCKNTMSKSTDTRNNQDNAENGAELSAEFTAFLRSESLRADLAAIDKNMLLDFINNNCGIKE